MTAHILIAGGGVAGIEAALALREFAGERASVEIIDPGNRFRIAAAATGLAFGVGSQIDEPLADVIARAGATHHHGRLASIDIDRNLAVIEGGALRRFDKLLIAVGARPRPFIPDALTFTGFAEVDAARDLIDSMVAGATRRQSSSLVVVVPPSCGWPLAAYELAVMARERFIAAGQADHCWVTVVTAEDAPLALFGRVASETVSDDLGRMGVAVRTGAIVTRWRWGLLELDGDALPADRVIALPVLEGPGIEGLPCDANGFIVTTPSGVVDGAPDIRVAGDAGIFPVKQGGLACQQADAAASAIATELGADAEKVTFDPILRGWLWDATGGRFLRGDLSAEHGQGEGISSRASLWWPVAKVAGRFLTPFLDHLDGPLRDDAKTSTQPPSWPPS